MIELRWVVYGHNVETGRELQYRWKDKFGRWGHWLRIKEIPAHKIVMLEEKA